MRVARVVISSQLLEDVLHFPKDFRVVGSCAQNGGVDLPPSAELTLLVEHPAFEDVDPRRAPLASLNITRTAETFAFVAEFEDGRKCAL